MTVEELMAKLARVPSETEIFIFDSEQDDTYILEDPVLYIPPKTGEAHGELILDAQAYHVAHWKATALP